MEHPQRNDTPARSSESHYFAYGDCNGKIANLYSWLMCESVNVSYCDWEDPASSEVSTACPPTTHHAKIEGGCRLG